MKLGKLYLLPSPIGDAPIETVLPAANRAIMDQLEYFVVENIRTARRFLSQIRVTRSIDSLHFRELNEHTSPQDISTLLAPLLSGKDLGLLSEAGVPAVADPGAELVALAHQHRIEVIPLVGPSSLLLALMSSGLNGQSFAFNGYLPIKAPERGQAIRHLEKRAQSERQSQLFIEAPYRNEKLFEELLSTCHPTTRLTLAVDLLQPDQLIRTCTISEWKKEKPELHKRPAVFIIG